MAEGFRVLNVTQIEIVEWIVRNTHRSRRGLGPELPPSLKVVPRSFSLIGLIMARGKKPPSSSAQYASAPGSP